MIKKDLYIFSDYYPYGKGEVFLHNEVLELSKYFKKITLLPRFQQADIRKLPENVEVNLMLTQKKWIDNLRLIIVHLFFYKHWTEFQKSSKRLGGSFYRNIKSFLGYCFDGHYYAEVLKKQNFEKSILYCYWYKHSAFGLALADVKSSIKIVRCHRGDLYEEKYILPFRKFISDRIDMIFSISEDGSNYLKTRYDILPEKIKVNRLGTHRLFEPEIRFDSEYDFQFVSCSALIPRKRVKEILLGINAFSKANPDKQIKYHHIGDGEMMEELQALAKNGPENLEVTLDGHLNNELIQKIYSVEKIDCFINFSISEGIPVSIMEALSYGIPIVATDVGGTSEIVNQEVGILLDQNAEIDSIAVALEKIIKGKADNKYLPETCMKHWKDSYSAIDNYHNFIQEIEQIKA